MGGECKDLLQQVDYSGQTATKLAPPSIATTSALLKHSSVPMFLQRHLEYQSLILNGSRSGKL